MYTLTLIDTDGRRIGAIPEIPVLPRFLHLHVDAEAVELSDDSEPTEDGGHIDSFARVVCVHVDGDKPALYVRMTA
jgi:hypothetical protein